VESGGHVASELALCIALGAAPPAIASIAEVS
jgi:hypothetical protein